MKKEFILIDSPAIARHLKKEGFEIVDIKAHKDDKDKTVFLFKRTKSLLTELNNITEELEKRK